MGHILGASWVGVHNLAHTVAAVTRVDGQLLLLAAAVGQAAHHAAALAASTCMP